MPRHDREPCCSDDRDRLARRSSIRPHPRSALQSPSQRPDSLSRRSKVRQYVAVDEPGRRADERRPRSTAPARAPQTGPDGRDPDRQDRRGRPRVERRRGPPAREVMDLAGHTVIPGIVGMHDHLFYTAAGGRAAQMSFTGPRLYLGERGHDHPHHRRPVALCRDQLRKNDRPGRGARAPHPSARRRTSRAAEGGGSMAVVNSPEAARRFVAYWAAGGRHLDQGLHRHPARRAGRRDRRGAQARHEGHRPSLLGEFPRSGGAGDRQPRARHAHRVRISTPEKQPDVCPVEQMGELGRPILTSETAKDVIQTHGRSKGRHDVDARGLRAVRRRTARPRTRGPSRR